MNLTLVILKTGQHLVAWCEELDYEPSCHMVAPHLIGGKTKITLTPWPSYTNDEHVLLHKTDILTVCEPNPAVSEAYSKKVAEPEALKSAPRPVILNEEEQVPDLTNDEYEPRYVEEPLY
jgi:hypothetical protein